MDISKSLDQLMLETVRGGNGSGDSKYAGLGKLDPTVAVLGLGGAGTWTILGLASAGVRRFKLVDESLVVRSHLDREVAYFTEDLGMPKVDAMKTRLTSWLDAEVETYQRRIEQPEDAAEILDGVDVAFCYIDEPQQAVRAVVTDALRDAGVAGIFAGHQLPFGAVGPLVIPDKPGCPECFCNVEARNMPYLLREIEYEPGSVPSLAGCTAVLAGIAFENVASYLQGEGTSLWRSQVVIDFRDWGQQRLDLFKHEECHRCTGLRLKHRVRERAFLADKASRRLLKTS